MIPTLLFPIGLAALAAGLLPLLVHLARRTEERPTDFAALRWLRQKPRPRHRPRFDERWLLALRLLLLAALAAFLSRPVLRDTGDHRRVVAVVPGARGGERVEGTRRLWLAPGFPAQDAPMPTGPLAIGSLLRQLDAELAPGTPLTLVVPAMLSGADAERPRLSRAVRWVVIPGTMPIATGPIPLRRAILRFDAAHRDDARYIRAAILALSLDATDAADVAKPLPFRGGIGAIHTQRARGEPPPPAPPLKGRGDADASTPLIWLASAPVPEPVLPDAVRRWAAGGGTVLVAADTIPPFDPAIPVWRDATGAVLAEAEARDGGRMLRLTRPLRPAAVPDLLDPGFPRTLAFLLAPTPPPGRVLADAYRPTLGGIAPAPPARDLRPWLGVAIALLWLLERWCATRRRRGVAP